MAELKTGKQGYQKSFQYGLAIFTLFFSLAALLLWLERPTGIVTGVVLDDAGQVLAGAEVYLEDYPFSRKTFADETGHFIFQQVPLGSYELRAKKRGFVWDYRYDQKVSEAKTTEVKEFKLQPVSPRLYVDLWDGTKLPGESVALSLWGAKVEKISFQAYQVDLVSFLKTGQRFGTLRDFEQALPQQDSLKSVATWEHTISADLVPEFEFKIPLKAKEQAWAFKRGLYVIEVQAKSLDGKESFLRKVLLNRTDLGMVLKSDVDKIALLSTDLAEAKPVGEMPVWFFSPGAQALELKTDAQGLLSIPRNTLQALEELQGKQATSMVVIQRGEALAFLAIPEIQEWSQSGEGHVVDEEAEVSGLFTMVYTERPLYRPGQEVFFKGISRQLQSNGTYQTVPLDNAVVSVQAPQSDVLIEENFSLSETGSFAGSFRLEEEADLGSYMVRTTVGGREYVSYFEVEEYRKPEFKVEVIPTQERFFAGDPITFNLNAQYFFGAPVVAQASWSLYRTPYFYVPLGEGLLPEYWGDVDDLGEGGGYGEFLQEGQIETNPQGQAQVKYTTAEAESDYRYTLRVTAHDLSNRNVENEGSTLVTAGDFFFRTQRDQFLAFPNQTFPLKIVTRSYDDKPVAIDYRIEVKRQLWDKLNYRYQYERAAKFSGQTNDEGQAVTEITLKQGGFYELRLEGKDNSGRSVAFIDYLWVSASKEDSEDFGLQNQVKIVAEKKKFQAGETGKFLLVGPQKNGQVLLTLEGDKLYEQRLVNLESFSKEIEIAFKKEWQPNIYLNVTALGKKDFYSDQVLLQVSPEQHFLNVDIQASQASYEPGQEVQYSVQIQDAEGNPVSTEFSLGVVDEKIYALQLDTTNVKNFFWGLRINRVETRNSLSGYFSGGIAKEDRNQLRRNFKDTAFWAARLKTDETGKAEVKFKLPDNLTTWRATLIAATTLADVGQQTHKVQAAKPLMAQIAAPRFFMAGDEVVLKALVHNYTEQTQELALDFELAEGLTWNNFSGSQGQKLTVPAKASASVDLPVKASEPGVAKIMLLAKTSLKAQTKPLQDGVELSIPILPFGIADHHYAQGKLVSKTGVPDQARVSLNLPAGTEAKTSKLHLSLDTTLVGQLLGSLDYLLQYPYGCVEQTMSRLLPALQIQQLASTLDLPTEQLEKKLPGILKRGFKRIQQMQNYEGGWGWWLGGEADVFMTSYAMYGLLQAKRIEASLPFKLNPQTLERGRETLEKILKAESKPEGYYFLGDAGTLAFVKYVAAMAGLKPELNDRSGNNDPLVLSLTLLTYLEQKQLTEAEQVLLQLEPLAQCQGEYCFFAATKKNEWRERSLLVNAWALKALAQATRQGLTTSLSLQEKLVQQLLSEREGGRWSQTLATAVVLDALSEYARLQTNTQTDIGISAQLNMADGKQSLLPDPIAVIESVSAHWEKTFSACDRSIPECVSQAVQGKAVPLNTGDNTLLISTNLGQSLYWQSDFAKLLPALDQSALNQGVSIKREYFQLKRVPKESSGVEFMAQAVLSQAKVGESIGVRLTITSEQDLHYVIFEDPKPSGMEVLPEIRFDEKAESTSYQSVRDEKVSFFRSYLKAGTHVFNYALMPELSGKFYILPPNIEEMYHPQTRGRGVSGIITVK